VRGRRRFCNSAGRQQLVEGAPVSRMPIWEQPTGCDSYGVQVPCRQLPDFGRLVYPMRGKVTTHVLLGGKRHGCHVPCRDWSQLMRMRVGNSPHGKLTVARVSTLAIDPPRSFMWTWEDSRTRCRGRYDLDGKQTRGPEHKGMTAAPKTDSLLKLHCRDTPTSRTPWDLREADAPREETGRCTGREWRGTGPSTYTRIVEITSGGTILQQGLAATCKDSSAKGRPEPSRGIWWGA